MTKEERNKLVIDAMKMSMVQQDDDPNSSEVELSFDLPAQVGKTIQLLNHMGYDGEEVAKIVIKYALRMGQDVIFKEMVATYKEPREVFTKLLDVIEEMQAENSSRIILAEVDIENAIH